MARTVNNNKTENDNKEIKWRKIGGGSFEYKGRPIKLNEEFYADPSDIPQAFRDVIIPLEASVTPSVIKTRTYKPELAEDESEELYFVVDNNGKKMMDKPMSLEDAKQLISNLES